MNQRLFRRTPLPGHPLLGLPEDRDLRACARRRGFRAAAIALAAAAALGACNLGRSNGTAVTIALPLSCSEVEANAGHAMAATFIAVAGAEFPPITEYRNQHPCSGETTAPPDDNIATYNVSIPDGDNRALAIAVLGEPINIGMAGLPDVVVHGIPLRTSTPRPVFFGGGVILKKAQLEGTAPRIELTLEPFVNMLGTVQKDGVAAAAHITFYAPAVDDDGCLAFFEDSDTTSLDKLYALDTAQNGAFLAAVPYRATALANVAGITCDNDAAHGNEVFGFAEGAGGAVALYVPGRADGPGRGLEPGALPGGTTIYLRDPENAAELLITSLSYVQSRVAHDFYVAGYSTTVHDPGTLPVQLTREASGEAIDVVLAVRKASTLGEGRGVRLPLDSYSKFRRFGTRKPFVMRLSTTRGLSAGSYSLNLEDVTFRFIVR